MGLYLFSGLAFEFPTHFGDCVSDSEGEVLLDSLFGLIEILELKKTIGESLSIKFLTHTFLLRNIFTND